MLPPALFSFNCSHHPEKHPISIKQSLPSPPCPITLIVTNLLSFCMNLPILGISDQRYNRIYDFCAWLLSLTILFWVFIQVVTCISSSSFLWLNETTFYLYITICLSIHLLMGIWGFPLFGYYTYCCYKHSCRSFCVDMCFHIFFSPGFIYLLEREREHMSKHMSEHEESQREKQTPCGAGSPTQGCIPGP